MSLKPYITKLDDKTISAALPFVIIAFGLVVRAIQYMANRSLWHDEANIVLDISNRTFSHLLLESATIYKQTAPIGFLLVEKSLTHYLGASEYAWRLYPFMCGIISLFLFRAVSRRFLTTGAANIALALFAICPPLIYFSSEVKQYSSDVAIVLLIYWSIGVTFMSKQTSARLVGMSALLGAVAIWFSFVSIFILAGIAMTLTVNTLWNHDWARLRRCLPAFVAWAASFGFAYMLSVENLAGNPDLLDFWSGRWVGPGAPPGGAFMPFPPASPTDVMWFVRTFFNILKYPTGFTLSGVAAFALLAGCASMFKIQRVNLSILVAPVFLALCASGLEKYPISGRTMLFAVPAALILIAEGAVFVKENMVGSGRALAYLLILLLFFHPTTSTVRHMFSPQKNAEIKEALTHYQKNKEPGDILYINSGSQRPIEYYRSRFDIKEGGYVDSYNSHEEWDWYNVEKDVEGLKGYPRVWALFSGIYRYAGLDEESLFVQYADQFGHRLQSFKTHGASIYLYDFAGQGSRKVNGTQPQR